MPTYEYKCEDCGNYFEVRATMEEKTRGLELSCDNCGGKKLEQVFSGFSLITNNRVDGSRGRSNGGGCCGGGGNSC